MPRTHHVIVGASIAGVSAAVAMRENGFDGTITLVDAQRQLPYERPALSKAADPEKAVRPILPEGHYAQHDLDLVLGARVRRLDDDRRRVVLDGGDDLPADRVLLTTGAFCRRLGVPGEGLADVHSLRTADDARRVFTSLERGGPLVVVGGGFIGLEAAAVARTMGVEVTVVEAGHLPLRGPLGPSVARLMTRLHQEHGVHVLAEQGVRSFLGSGSVEEVVLTEGRRLPAAAVIVGIGVAADDRIAREVGATCENGVVVDSHGRTDHPWLWSAGDVASHIHPAVGTRARIEHWDVAMRHGAAVGASMAGRPTVNTAVPYFWTDQYGKSLQMFGRTRPQDRVVLREGATPERFLAFWLREDRVVAVAGLDEAKAVRAARALVESGAPVPADVLADPSTDLRALSRGAARQALSFPA
ncbi:NAD(P)/FAD-dependent oxidoreductase [Streptomyces ipomoeae]|uniref:NAD(P)/FAD-dependent oxidoreductase n=1 Tax=Streptomyces ipomoeae TaxID=103232 RepID=UPI0011462ADE|nr:FAD-dependent oxidoreductase [Streptomyces ipomoeae]MDX2937919.1 FAD-dependent oxidoreductase [Streptomyces ipomoeae]TQE18298.1 pyridine nucleotide-disulfide oxidoreductase [Streptomyces ipomoeae]